jgi:predicted  nucleic acid-binding Zn-ribbon protein
MNETNSRVQHLANDLKAQVDDLSKSKSDLSHTNSELNNLLSSRAEENQNTTRALQNQIDSLQNSMQEQHEELTRLNLEKQHVEKLFSQAHESHQALVASNAAVEEELISGKQILAKKNEELKLVI